MKDRNVAESGDQQGLHVLQEPARRRTTPDAVDDARDARQKLDGRADGAQASGQISVRKIAMPRPIGTAMIMAMVEVTIVP